MERGGMRQPDSPGADSAAPPRPGARDIAVVLAVEGELLATGLALALSTRPQLHLVAVAHSVAQAQHAVSRHDPDIVLIESTLARGLAARLAPPQWRARILVLGRHAHLGVEPPVDTNLLCGFLGFGSSSRHYLSTLDAVTACPRTQAAADSSVCAGCSVRRTLALPPLQLTGRELEVFSLTGRGYGSSEIARLLQVSTKTVDAHRESIKHKLGLDSARALNLAAARWCLGEDIAAPLLRGKYE